MATTVITVDEHRHIRSGSLVVVVHVCSGACLMEWWCAT